MKHPDEHTLELYVLNADSVANRRGEIEEHCDACTGCTLLLSEISSFYAELDRELRQPDPIPEVPAGRQLVKRNPGLALWEERLAVGPWTGWGRPVKKLRHYIRRYPIAAAGTTFAFAAVAGLGLLMGYREVGGDVNPSHVSLNSQTGYFEVYNRGNELLWKRLLDNPMATLGDRNLVAMPRYVLFDLDNDGHREVLTTFALGGEPTIPEEGLHIFNGLGDYYNVDVDHRINFRGIRYEMPLRVNGGSMILIDSSN